MSKPVWLESWDWDVQRPFDVDTEGSIAVFGETSYVNEKIDTGHRRGDADRARLAAAAPAMVRALLAAEWEGHRGECPECTMTESHKRCQLDAALTAAGFPTQAERDSARKLMRGTDGR